MNDSLIETLEDWLASVISEGQPYRAKTLRQTIEALKPIEELEAKVEKLTAALGSLVALKAHKSIRGKDAHYLRNQPAAWEQAKAALSQESE